MLQLLVRERYADALELHRALLRQAFDRHGGYELECEGDAFFVAFARAEQAVTAAADAQTRLAAADWPEEQQVRVRIGIHTGEPLVKIRCRESTQEPMSPVRWRSAGFLSISQSARPRRGSSSRCRWAELCASMATAAACR